MSVLKTAVSFSIVLGLFAPSFAFAQTSTTSATTLVNQIQTFQSQINALKAQQQEAIAALVTTLKQGTTSDQVAVLQALLASDPSIYPEGIISGYFGKLTAQAVKRFQKMNGLDQVGNVGPKTLKMLQKLLDKYPLAFGSASTTSATGNRGQGNYRRLCAIIPPGHLIAPGWLKKHASEDGMIVSECQSQNLPKGIRDALEGKRGSDTTTDIVAPTISRVETRDIATTTAVVRWETNEKATSQVEYGISTSYGSSTALSLSLVKLHNVTLSGLTASTTYYYRVASKDAANNLATSSTQSFVTTN